MDTLTLKILVFHHDGPFDACNPHRNRKRDLRAPMQAFPANSANNMLGGSGPLRSRLDLDRIGGVGPEGYSDYATVGNNEQQGRRKFSFEKNRNFSQMAFDPYAKVPVVHGDDSLGLGTSTFLEGTVASRRDIQRQNSEQQTVTLANDGSSAAAGGGVTRKKSLVQRIRGMSQTRRPADLSFNQPNSPTSPARKGSLQSPTFRPARGPQSAGGRMGAGRVGDSNPFFNDYNDAYEKKGATIKAKDVGASSSGEKPLPMSAESRGRLRAPSSPTMSGRGLRRTVTEDGTSEAAAGLTRSTPAVPVPATTDGAGTGGEAAPAGFMGRMKSLRGRKKTVA